MIYLRRHGLDASPLQLMAGHNYQANPLAAAFAPDGRSIAVAFPDRVNLWGTEDVNRPPFRAGIAVASVRALAFHPAGRRLVTASADGMLPVWNVDGTGPVSADDGGVGCPGALAFTPDGSIRILGGEGGRLALQRETYSP